MKVAVAQLGPRNHYAEARVLYTCGYLEHLFTDIYAGDKPRLLRAIAFLPHLHRLPDVRRFLGRVADDIPPEKVTSFDLLGARAILALRRARSEVDRYRVYDEIGSAFQRAVIRRGLGKADTLLVSTGAAAELIEHACRLGIRSILQQFQPPFERLEQILHEERERWPNAERVQPEPLPEELVARLLDEERRALEGAHVVLVASEYTKKSLFACGYDISRTRVVPLAVDTRDWKPREEAAGKSDGRLRVLYAGNIDLRKGVLYLIEAIKKLRSRKVEVKLAGVVNLRQELLVVPSAEVELLGPVPRSDMPELMRWADLFVFPTLGEGFGLVQVEALACGTPVIATTECGEVVRDGIEGHIVPPRNSDAIAHWLDYYAADPKALVAMREAAVRRAQEFCLDAYAGHFIQALTLYESTYVSRTYGAHA